MRMLFTLFLIVLPWLSFLATPMFSQSQLLDLTGFVDASAIYNKSQTNGESTATIQENHDDVNGFFAKIAITGFVDVYFGYNFNRPTSRINQLRNFDFRDQRFCLNLGELAVTRIPEPFGFRLDLNYGPRTTDWIHASEPANSELVQYVQQAFVSYKAPVGKGLTVDVGKFVTQHGAEVIETKDNWNYSRSLLFAWAIPYYHFGVRAGYPIHARFTFNTYLVNGWNNVVDNNRGKTFGLQGIWTPHRNVSFVLNYMVGPEQATNTSPVRELFDTVITFFATPKLSLMLNYDYGRDRADTGAKVHWNGLAGYARYSPTPWLTFSPRWEWFNDSDGFATGQAQELTEVTITNELRVAKNLFSRLEFRQDRSTVDFFENDSGKKRTQTTIVLGAFYVLP